MRSIIACVAFVFALFSPSTHAVGPFDGIWSLNAQNTFIGWVSIQENNGTVIAIVHETDLTWNAFQGPRSGSNFNVTTILGSISAQYTGSFTSTTTYQATQIFCTPVTGPCGLPNGTIVTGTKVW
jgi:hypothetical protein